MKFFQKYFSLPREQRAIVPIFFLYNFTSSFGTIFINTYIFYSFGSISNILLYNLIFYTTIYFGFVGAGYVWSQYKWNVKYLFLLAFSGMAFSFFLLLFVKSEIIVPLFGTLYGITFGIFWVGAHSYELNFVSKNSRGLYSSVIVLSKDFFGVFVPLCVSFLFFISKTYISFGVYPVLFSFFALLNILSFFLIQKLPDFFFGTFLPKMVFNFFPKFGTFKTAYVLLQAQTLQIARLTTIFLFFYVFTSEIEIGMYQAFTFFISLLIGSQLGLKLNDTNKLRYFSLISLGIIVLYIFLFFHLSLSYFLIFLVCTNLAFSLYGICDKVFSMDYMGDISLLGKDFLSKICQRETLYFVSRFIPLLGLYLLSIFTDSGIAFITKFFILYTAFLIFLSFLMVFLDTKFSKN